MTWENRAYFEISSADPDAAEPVWVDFSMRVRDELQMIRLATGRQSDLDQVDPSRLDLMLDNIDGWLTYGNSASPYASWWGPGRLCRLRETIAGVTENLFTGYLQTPTEHLITAAVEQRVSIVAVDRMGRLHSAAPSASTVAAHIAGSGHGALVGYWPLVDADQPFRPVVGLTPAIVQIATGTPTPIETRPTATAGAGEPLPGDDVPPVHLAHGTNAGVTSWGAYLTAGGGWQLTAGQVATAVVWLRTSVAADEQCYALEFTTGDGIVSLYRQVTSSGGTWRVTSPIGSLTGSVSSTVVVGTDHYYILGVRYGFSPNVLELWVDDQIHVATLTGVYAGINLLGGLSTGLLVVGSVAHLQMYVGAPSDWTHADFLAQRQVGLSGLERQSTGDRIRTVARYAGIPDSQIEVDKGCSVMQIATLAGQTPLDAMRDAERTEQGLLYVDGDGNVIFRDRRTLYNI